MLIGMVTLFRPDEDEVELTGPSKSTLNNLKIFRVQSQNRQASIDKRTTYPGLCMYDFIDLEDLTKARAFLTDEETNKDRTLETLGRAPFPPGTTRRIEYILAVHGITMDTPESEVRVIWDEFISLMISSRIDEDEVRSRYPWGVWRLRASGIIAGAPALFEGVTINADGGLYQIHHYPIGGEQE